MISRFNLGDRVRKTRGGSWQGVVVGHYRTALTPDGVAVESEREPGSVQIYPVTALELVPQQAAQGGERERFEAAWIAEGNKSGVLPAEFAWWGWNAARAAQGERAGVGLTPDQIAEIGMPLGDSMWSMSFARAIERACAEVWSVKLEGGA